MMTFKKRTVVLRVIIVSVAVIFVLFAIKVHISYFKPQLTNQSGLLWRNSSNYLTRVSQGTEAHSFLDKTDMNVFFDTNDDDTTNFIESDMSNDTCSDILNSNPIGKCFAMEKRFNRTRTWLLHPEKCANEHIVLLIKSSIYRNNLRSIIRRTWGQQFKNLSKYAVKRIFIIGKSSGVMPLINRESSLYKDLLQCDIVDDFNSVAEKVLHGMRFAMEYCPRAKFVFVPDDDAIILPWVIFPLTYDTFDRIKTRGVDEATQFAAGFIVAGSRRGRDPTHRWYVSPDIYKCDTYPTYLSGTAYVMSMATVRTFYEISQCLTLFQNEDALFGGVALLANVSLTGFDPSFRLSGCDEATAPHKSSRLEFATCHDADMPCVQKNVWSEMCFRSKSTSREKLIILQNYCNSVFSLQ